MTDPAPILNPRYEGATPEMVARALLRRPVTDRRKPKDEEPPEQPAE